MAEIKITNVPPTVKEQLENIADHMGVETGSFLKTELRHIIDRYPEKMRLPKNDEMKKA